MYVICVCACIFVKMTSENSAAVLHCCCAIIYYIVHRSRLDAIKYRSDNNWPCYYDTCIIYVFIEFMFFFNSVLDVTFFQWEGSCFFSSPFSRCYFCRFVDRVFCKTNLVKSSRDDIKIYHNIYDTLIPIARCR